MHATTYGKQFYDTYREGSLSSAREVVPIVLELVAARRVVELGCGVGAWLSVLKDHGVSEILGVDGDYVDRGRLLIPKDHFLPYDLEKPFRIGRKFDLAIALEVAEHLPARCAETFVDSLTRLAPVVLFSAAIPFQGGTHHLNEQWQDFWAHIFQRRDYVTIDCIRERVWQNDKVRWWYAQNTLIYAHAEFAERSPTLREAYQRTCVSQLRMVHPERYLMAVDPGRMKWRNILSLARKVALRSIK